jgi:hypothetical protein
MCHIRHLMRRRQRHNLGMGYVLLGEFVNIYLILFLGQSTSRLLLQILQRKRALSATILLESYRVFSWFSSPPSHRHLEDTTSLSQESPTKPPFRLRCCLVTSQYLGFLFILSTVSKKLHALSATNRNRELSHERPQLKFEKRSR